MDSQNLSQQWTACISYHYSTKTLYVIVKNINVLKTTHLSLMPKKYSSISKNWTALFTWSNKSLSNVTWTPSLPSSHTNRGTSEGFLLNWLAQVKLVFYRSDFENCVSYSHSYCEVRWTFPALSFVFNFYFFCGCV